MNFTAHMTLYAPDDRAASSYSRDKIGPTRQTSEEALADIKTAIEKRAWKGRLGSPVSFYIEVGGLEWDRTPS